MNKFDKEEVHIFNDKDECIKYSNGSYIGDILMSKKWFCSKDAAPNSDTKVVLRIFSREESPVDGIDYEYKVRNCIGEYRDGYENNTGLCFLVDNINPDGIDGDYFIEEENCFRDIDENGDIVHFVYWRYLDE